MRKIILMLFILFLGMGVNKATAQADELAQLALNIEKLAQFKSVLSDLKKGYQILSTGYNTVKDVSKGNFDLHKAFLDGLMEVSPTVRRYYKITRIIENQLELIRTYKAAYHRFRSIENFKDGELEYIAGVYGHLMKESLSNLEELLTVTTAGKLRMSDDDRLKAIDRIDADMEDKLSFLRSFNNNTSVLAFQREKEKTNLKTSFQLNGVNK